MLDAHTGPDPESVAPTDIYTERRATGGGTAKLKACRDTAADVTRRKRCVIIFQHISQSPTEEQDSGGVSELDTY